MKIRLGMLDQDLRYMRRLTDYFNVYYADKLEVSVFSSLENLTEFLKTAKIDVLFANYEIEQGQLPKSESTVLAYFADTQDTETINDVRTVCKYQKAELIYNEVLNLYAELDLNKSFSTMAGDCPIYLFMGVAGGVGTTAAAIACAANFNQCGKRVLYLNLEENGVLEPFLIGEGNTGLSDALYAVKSNRANLSLKLQTIVRKDESDICFFAPFDASLDAADMDADDVTEFIRALKATSMFDCIVVDADVLISKKRNVLMNMASQIFLVNDGRDVSNQKMQRVLQSLQIIDERDETRILVKCSIVYNKFGSLSTQQPSDLCGRVFGVMSRYEGGNSKQVLEQLVKKNLFASIATNA